MSNEKRPTAYRKEYGGSYVVGNRSTFTQNKTGILKRQILNLSCKTIDHASKKMGESG